MTNLSSSGVRTDRLPVNLTIIKHLPDQRQLSLAHHQATVHTHSTAALQACHPRDQVQVFTTATRRKADIPNSTTVAWEAHLEATAVDSKYQRDIPKPVDMAEDIQATRVRRPGDIIALRTNIGQVSISLLQARHRTMGSRITLASDCMMIGNASLILLVLLEIVLRRDVV